MPRQARLDTPGALHHIMVREINRSDIFDDYEDRSRFLTSLGQNILETQSSLYAWVLMETHVDLLVRSGQQGISALMRKLLTWYAQYYNRGIGGRGIYLKIVTNQSYARRRITFWHL